MSIGRIQLSRTIKKIIKHYLHYGRYPSFQTITHHLSGWLRRHSPGTPSFDPMKAIKKGDTNEEEYNQNIKEIHTDLTDGYQATINHINRRMNDFSFIQTERDKLSHDLALLENEIDKLLMVESNVDNRYFEGEIISFENADSINQEISNISLDLKKRHVNLKEMNYKTSKIAVDPSRASFQTLMPKSRTAALESLARAFDENINTSWWEVVKTKTPGSIDEENNMGMRAELVVMFDEPTSLNEIHYNPHHGKSVYTKIEYTTNGTSFHPVQGNQNYKEVTGFTVWEFPAITASGVKFIYEKKEHDDRSAGQYQFYFGAKDISFFKKAYEPTGVLYTYPIRFDSPVRMLSIEADDTRPVQTNIQYEIASYRNDVPENNLTWHPISSIDEKNPKSAQYIEFNTKYIRTAHIQKTEETGQIINGMRVFRMMKDNGDPIISEILEDAATSKQKETFDEIKNAQLFRGINQWKREKTYLPFKAEVPLNHVWTTMKEKDPESVHIDYLAIDNTLNLSGAEDGRGDNFFRFTTCVYIEEEKVSPMSISMLQTLPNGIRKRLGTYSIYVNQERMKTTHDEITMKLKDGWNEISLLYHWGNMQERKDLRNDELPQEAYLGKFNFRNQINIRADLKPMTYIDTHELFHNVSPNNRDYFTVHERQIALNYMSKDCLYQIRYEADISETLLTKELLLRATLERDPLSESSTPAISKIKLRVR